MGGWVGGEKGTLTFLLARRLRPCYCKLRYKVRYSFVGILCLCFHPPQKIAPIQRDKIASCEGSIPYKGKISVQKNEWTR